MAPVSSLFTHPDTPSTVSRFVGSSGGVCGRGKGECRVCAHSGTGRTEGRSIDPGELRRTLQHHGHGTRPFSGTPRSCPAGQRTLPTVRWRQRQNGSKPDLPSPRHSLGIPPLRTAGDSLTPDLHSRPGHTEPLAHTEDTNQAESLFVTSISQSLNHLTYSLSIRFPRAVCNAAAHFPPPYPHLSTLTSIDLPDPTK